MPGSMMCCEVFTRDDVGSGAVPQGAAEPGHNDERNLGMFA